MSDLTSQDGMVQGASKPDLVRALMDPAVAKRIMGSLNTVIQLRAANDDDAQAFAARSVPFLVDKGRVFENGEHLLDPQADGVFLNRFHVEAVKSANKPKN